ncbi:MAG: hypothetical protein IKJ35_01750 [Clostridia bacterium]|nr:hypothetical protein [Clostridia bacterium]
MKKRLVCLVLCLVMLLPMVLSSCSKKDDESATEDIEKKASESAMTLTMWIVSEEKIAPATAAAVSAQINAVTKSKFKTQLVINYLTEDEYKTTLEKTIAAYEESGGAVEEMPPVGVEPETEVESGAVTDETETNEWGLTVIKYPELLANQVDIIYISGEDMYIDFIEKDWLAELDTELSGSSKKIKEYVSSTLLSAAKHNGTTYALPNNLVIGEYTYMLLNKELMKKYNQHAYAEKGMIDGFYNENLYSFLNLIYLFEKDVIPVDASYDECLDLLAHYWSIDSETYEMLDEFSVFGAYYRKIEELNRGSAILGFDSLFADPEFAADYLKLNEFRFKDYFRQSDDTETRDGGVAVKFITGDSSIMTKNEYVDENGDAYYPVIVGYPTATSEDIYGNMFGVCKYSKSVSRSMQIITYMNTNAYFRNLLQYGVEGVHYTVTTDENGVKSATRLNSDYMMDLYATGNAFLAYIDTQSGMSKDIWESGKVQNRDSFVDPLLGLNFKEHAASMAPEFEESISLDSCGYNISFSSGYSKEIFSQNEVIKDWLTECDKAGKGIYVLSTSEVDDDQFMNATYYVYNNDVSKKLTFNVEDKRVMGKKKDEKTGKDVEVQTDLDFILTYATADGSAAKYELSVFNLYTKKDNEFELKCKVNDKAKDLKITNYEGALNFDLLHTKNYSIDGFFNLSKPTVLENDVLNNWFNECDAKIVGKNAAQFLMHDRKEVGDKAVYTFVVYRANLKLATNFNLILSGDLDNLVLNFYYPYGEEMLNEQSDPTYLLEYIQVTVDKDAKVDTVTINGDKQEAYKLKTAGNPEFKPFGNLDTELIKFMEKLNDNIAGENGILETKFQEYYQAYRKVADNPASTPAAIDAALNTAIEKYAQLVSEISLLLSTGEEAPVYNQLNFKTLFATLKNDWKYVCDNRFDSEKTTNLKEIHQYLKFITNYEKQTIMVLNEETMKMEEGYYQGKEDYVYYDSPFAVYYSWMASCGYLPKEKK